MLGELIRDGGMLACVFGVLDAAIKMSAGEEHLVAWWWYPRLIAISISLVAIGIFLERTRSGEP